MRTTLALLLALAAAAASFAGCDLDLEPHWSSPHQATEVNPFPGATCEDICGFEAEACLMDQCTGGTMNVWEDGEDPFTAPGQALPADCDEPIRDVAGGGDGWALTVACCCSG